MPRGSLVIIAGALTQFGIPLEGVAMILGVDQLMDMARTGVNMLGHCVATAAVARWEGVELERQPTEMEHYGDRRATGTGCPSFTV